MTLTKALDHVNDLHTEKILQIWNHHTRKHIESGILLENIVLTGANI